MENDRRFSDEEFAKLVLGVPAVGDRVRLVALDQTGVLAGAKERSLRRELAIKTARFGKDSSQVQALAERLRLQQGLRTQIDAEVQRAEIVVPERRSDVFVLHGRVVDQNHIGQTELTVSAVDLRSRPATFTCTDARGYFKLEIPTRATAEERALFLQVSDKNQAILFRGKEAHGVTAGGVVYREIVLGEQREEPCPPPPEPETVLVPDLIGVPETRAIEVLRAARLKVGDRTTAPMRDKVGLVLVQDPKASTEVPIDTAVNLVIGVAETVRVPGVVGLNMEEARVKIQESGLKVGAITERARRRAGIVLEQKPSAEEEVPIETSVDLVVGKT
jgi:hypothetical protein